MPLGDALRAVTHAEPLCCRLLSWDTPPYFSGLDFVIFLIQCWASRGSLCKLRKREIFSKPPWHLECDRIYTFLRVLLVLLEGSTKSRRRKEGRVAQKKCLICSCLQFVQSRTSPSRQRHQKWEVMEGQKANAWKQIPANNNSKYSFIPTLWSTGIGSASKQVTKVWNNWCFIAVALSYLDFPKAVQMHWRNCHALQRISCCAPVTGLLWPTAWISSWGMNLWGSSGLKGWLGSSLGICWGGKGRWLGEVMSRGPQKTEQLYPSACPSPKLHGMSLLAHVWSIPANLSIAQHIKG